MKSFHDNISDLKHFHPGAFSLAVLGTLLLSGCFIDFANYGRYQPSREVGALFESGRLPPDYNYYYAGSDKNPEAIIGLDPIYTLKDDDLWKRTALNPGQIERWVAEMTNLRGYALAIYGSYIVSPDGKVIGIYYSRWHGGPVFMQSGNQVVIHLPDVREGPRRPTFVV